MYDIFYTISQLKEYEFNPSESDIQNPTSNEPIPFDISPPGRVETYISRYIRDTQLVKEIKNENNYSCQVCGETILLPNGNNYAEGHHLQPLGGVHKGPDIRENIIILCPNHHSEFDYLSIAINHNTLIIEHIDPNNKYHDKPLAYFRNDIARKFLEYHYRYDQSYDTALYDRVSGTGGRFP